MNTITETVKRLRAAAEAARLADGGIRLNDRVEVGLRAIPVYMDRRPLTPDEAFAEGDDLDETLPIAEAARVDQTRRDGYVAHLYFSSTGPDGELLNVITVWTGGADRKPVVVHLPRG